MIVGGVLASQGKLQIELVIAVAALAAIVGDNIGYQIGRKGGRWLLDRPGPFHRHRLMVLETGEPFFERHGPKAVFFGRFILGLRTWASWLAGANHMRWRTFFLWNALGGICWATGVGLIAYFVGHSASNAITTFGIYGLVAVVVAAGGGFLLHRRHQRIHRAAEESKRRQRAETTDDGTLVGGALRVRPSSDGARRSQPPQHTARCGPTAPRARRARPRRSARGTARARPRGAFHARRRGVRGRAR